MTSRTTASADMARELSKDIEAGVYPPGQRLPGATRLAVIYGVSLGVARMALHSLCRRGVIVVKGHVGHFVAFPDGQEVIDTATLTKRVADDLRKKITSGVYEPAQRLPSIRQLAAQYQVSTAPIRQAIEQLTDEELIVVVRHDGAYVAVPDEAAEDLL